MTPPAVLVAVPARDEEDSVASTLLSVLAALHDATRHGLVRGTHVEVAAHRCRDATLPTALAALDGATSARVVRDETSETVGEVRHAAVLRGLAALDTVPAETWVFSTDADTLVGTGWVRRALLEADAAGAEAVVGLADLDGWRGPAEARAAYDEVLAAKMRQPLGPHQHDHVYGANLAVRADAYLACGGFPTRLHGEDQALVDRLDLAGRRVLRTGNVRVRTSGRLVGRAEHGLADHLRRIALAAEAVPGTDTA